MYRSIAGSNPGMSAMAQHMKNDHKAEYEEHKGGRGWKAVLNALAPPPL